MHNKHYTRAIVSNSVEAATGCFHGSSLINSDKIGTRKTERLTHDYVTVGHTSKMILSIAAMYMAVNKHDNRLYTGCMYSYA